MRRSELYALAWSEPLRHLGPKLGFTDRGLGLVCARFDIPVPYRGYWAKRAAGKDPKRTPLPDPSHDDLVEPLQAFDGSGQRVAPEDIPDEWIIPGVLKRSFTPPSKPTVRSPPLNQPTYPSLRDIDEAASLESSVRAPRLPTSPGPVLDNVRLEEEAPPIAVAGNTGGVAPSPADEPARPPLPPLLPVVEPVSPERLLRQQGEDSLRDQVADMQGQLNRVFATAAQQQRHHEAAGVLAAIALRASSEDPATALYILKWVAEVRRALDADDPIAGLLKSLRAENSRLAA